MDYYDRAKYYAEISNDKHGLSRVLFSMGEFYLFQDNYVKALRYFFTSLELVESINLEKGKVF